MKIPVRPVIPLAYLALSALPAFASAPQDILDAPPLSIEAPRLRSLIDTMAVDSSRSVRVIAEESVLSFSADGLLRRTERLIYRIEGENGLGDWSQVGRDWSPWLEVRPEIRARVVSSDGQEHFLDPATMSDAAIPSADPDLLTDNHMLRAPLPAVRRGSIIEEYHVFSDTALAVGPDRQLVLPFARTVPVALRRIVIEAPVSLPLHWEVEKRPDVVIDDRKEDGLRRVTFVVRDEPAEMIDEFAIPSDVPSTSALWVSTARDWSGTARAYAAAWSRRIAGDPDPEVIDELARSVRESLAGADRDRVVEVAVRRLHRDVRYTGVEFGEAKVIPSWPSETVRRRFGDCKDKSTLLIALLAKLGVPATMAVLHSGPGRDLRPDVAGWGLFDHAIVLVPGSPELWIDATDAFGRPGVLPAGAEGRWALVVAPSTTELRKTPDIPSTANVLSEVRDIRLAERGGARVTEVTRATGHFESEYRTYYGHPEESGIRGGLEDYARDAYQTAEKAVIRTTPVDDFSAPFEMTIEASGAGVYETTLANAVVTVPRILVFSHMPDFLGLFDPDSIDMAAYSGRRHNPAEFVPPFIVETTFRIRPPPGYEVLDLPESRSVALGAATFDQELGVDSTGTVTATVRLDSGRRRWSADEVHAFRSGLSALIGAPDPRILFQHAGLAKLDDGDLVAAARILRDEASDRDRVAAQIRYTKVLLAAGLGQAARDRARSLAGQFPDDVEVRQNLAVVLQHDLLGRYRSIGFDRPGALAAYRRLREDHPDDYGILGNLAIVCEYDDDALHYGPGADLDEAVAIYKSIPADEATKLGIANNLPILYLRADRAADLESWCTGQPRTGTTILFQAVAASMLRGADAGLRVLQAVPGDRGELCAQAAALLMISRYYPEAAAFFRAAAVGRPDASRMLAQATQLESIRRFDRSRIDPLNPRHFASRMMDALLNFEADPEGVLNLMSADLRSRMQGSDMDSTRAVARIVRKFLESSSVTPEVMLDFTTSLNDMTVEGDSLLGYRITPKSESTAEAGGFSRLYLKPEKGRLVSITYAGDGPLLSAGPAGEAYRALRRGDAASARRWLTWAAKDLAAAEAVEDSLDLEPFRIFWKNGSDDPERMKLAALSLLTSMEPEDVLKIREAPPGSAETLALQIMQLESLNAQHRDEELLKRASALAPEHPGSRNVYRWRIAALDRLHRVAEAETLASQRLADHPDDPDALRTLMLICRLQDRCDEAWNAFHRLENTGKLNAEDINDINWMDFVADRASRESLERINKAILMQKTPTYGVLHTQACLYAEVGRVVEGREVLFQAMDLEGFSAPTPPCWLVLGRIAEQLGFTEEARSAYRKVETEPREFGLDDPLAGYVRRRMESLGG